MTCDSNTYQQYGCSYFIQMLLKRTEKRLAHNSKVHSIGYFYIFADTVTVHRHSTKKKTIVKYAFTYCFVAVLNENFVCTQISKFKCHIY